VGRSATIRAAWNSTRRGGRATVVGIGSKDDQVSFNALEVFHFARTLTACVYGDGVPDRDIPLLAEHVRAGRLDLEALITDRITLDDIPAAFDRMREGKGGRSLIVF
jgi:S-(hydroxymethyl)glutathione dehydrogenase/alcohol dehydrogenase